VLHDAGPVKQVGGQISDADILALRLPHTSEVIEGVNENICTAHHQRLEVRDDLIDFVIAEVTSERACKFNWLQLNDAQFRFVIQYVIRRFGYWSPDEQADVIDVLVKCRADSRDSTGLSLGTVFGFGFSVSASKQATSFPLKSCNRVTPRFWSTCEA